MNLRMFTILDISGILDIYHISYESVDVLAIKIRKKLQNHTKTTFVPPASGPSKCFSLCCFVCCTFFSRISVLNVPSDGP